MKYLLCRSLLLFLRGVFLHFFSTPWHYEFGSIQRAMVYFCIRDDPLGLKFFIFNIVN